ncbi:pH-dependent sodium/proton antiporter [Serratia plymuthica]|uniref:pH-dependent sodium/proton antiporter n=1 Tax=Serratia plymuthica TaxID=82996 RepID=A0A2X4U7A2_SERPL|nr:pH-dependent sodium/proton antiporter [Serratia plymuthica]
MLIAFINVFYRVKTASILIPLLCLRGGFYKPRNAVERRIVTNIIRQFLRQEAAGGIILIVAAIIALIMANTRLRGFITLFSIYLSW